MGSDLPSGVISEATGEHEQVLQLDNRFAEILLRIEDKHPEVAHPYVEASDGLYDVAGNIEWMFPDEAASDAVQQIRNVVSGIALELEQHLDNGSRTDDVLHLRGDREMPVAMLGTEPLLAVDDLRLVYWMAGQVESNPDIVPILVNSADGRRIWQFVDTSGRLPTAAALYIRPKGSTNVDPRYDFGHSSGFVQAKIGFNVDVDILRTHFNDTEHNTFIDITRSKAGAYTNIALRNELEPAKPGGGNAHTKALAQGHDYVPMHDIAALNGNGRSIRIGQVVAVGHDMYKGSSSSHIHIENVFPPGYEDPEVFSDYVLKTEEKMTQRRMSPDVALARARSSRPIPESSGFHEFQPGDNPYDIDGVREIAHSVGLELKREPTDEEVQQMFSLMGIGHVFRENIRGFSLAARQMSQQSIAKFILSSGITSPMRLRTVEGVVSENSLDIEHAVGTEGTAPWMDRRISYIRQLHERGVKIGSVLLAASERQLDTPTEVAYPSVVQLYKDLGRVPTAADYMERVSAPALAAAGLAIKGVVTLPAEQQQTNGNVRHTSAKDLAAEMATRYPEIADGKLLLAQNAPATWTFWSFLQEFNAHLGTGANPYDGRRQFLFGGNGVLLAQNQSELDSRLFQNTWTAASAIPRFVIAVNGVNKLYGSSGA